MEDPQKILDALQDHFVPVRNILCERYIFHNTEKQAHETIDQYLIKLRRLAEPCQFGNLEDEMVRDRLLLGCKDSAARARLFREKSCDLKKAVSETTCEQLKEIEGNGMHEPINYVDKEPPRKPPLQKKSDRTKKRDGNTSGWKSRECISCDGIHEHNKNKCPAFGESL